MLQAEDMSTIPKARGLHVDVSRLTADLKAESADLFFSFGSKETTVLIFSL